MEKVFVPGHYFFTTFAAPVAPMREGMKFIASFDSPVEKLQIRRGRLTALVDGMWHIIDTDPKSTNG